MDLLSLVFSLRPVAAPNLETPLPIWWGRAAHALLLNTVRQVDENLAAELHDGQMEPAGLEASNHNSTRPFTASTLMGRFAKGALDPRETYSLRLTAFRADLAQILLNASLSGSLAVGQKIELDYLPFEILAIQPAAAQPAETSSPWAAVSSCQELAAPYLLGKVAAPRRISFQFTSPTTFKSAGRHVPVPLPTLVFGSLLERWNAYAPINFPLEAKRYADECLAISKYDLQTRPVPQKSRGIRVGALGSVTFTSLNYDRYWMGVMAVLAQFSLFSGVGAGTSQGLGQCRRLPELEKE